uniref:Uncharacterized protein n=1 Tax=viral metagenome TaxID=1070528 RepID=A0A6C0KLS6_9ZZZZ
MSNSTRKIKKKRKNNTCKWDSCDQVPCGKSMPHCKPHYCYRKGSLSSRNWKHCNMRYLSSNPVHKEKCKKEMKEFSKCKRNMTKKKTTQTVDVQTLHEKMPYIWRFLRVGTRKNMIRLAQLPISEINIQGSLYGEVPSKKNKHKFERLRQKYKDI